MDPSHFIRVAAEGSTGAVQLLLDHAIVKLLLEHGADVNAQGGWYGTPLQAAAFGGYLEIVKLLLEHGAEVNAQVGQYGTALQAATSGGYPEVVKLLLEHGADVNIKGGQYGSALLAAVSRGRMGIVQVLLEKQEIPIPHAKKAFEMALRNSNAVGVVSLFLAIQPNKINITDEVLMTAAKSEQRVQLVALLLVSSAAISEDLIWARELRKAGYRCQDIIDIFLEDKNDSPWTFFQPNSLPHLEIQPARHIPMCHHLLSHRDLGPMQTSDLSIKGDSTLLTHQEILHLIQEKCGLAGISPTTRTMTDWVGMVELNANDQTISVSYALPKNEGTSRSTGVILSRIYQALERMSQAVTLMQQNNFCCNSFTVLRSGSQAEESSPSFIREITSIPLKLIIDLLVELKNGINSAFGSFDYNKLLSVSKKVLGHVWRDIPEGSSVEWCFHLCALSVQFLSLGCLSYSQAHRGPIRLFFLEFLTQEFRLMGFQREQSLPFLVAEMVNLTCLSGMTRGQVLCFRASGGLSRNQPLVSPYDILGHVNDLLDTWGPGNLIVRESDHSIIAIKLGDGFIIACGGVKFHWTKHLPEIKTLDPIDTGKPLLIGSLVSINTACQNVETDCRDTWQSCLENLGTTPSYWEGSQRQLAAQAGQYVVLQAAATYNKHPGIPEKDRALAYPPQELIQFLDYYWGVQVSFCTGVARRVRLRTMIADIMHHFLPPFTHHPSDFEEKLRDETLQISSLLSWISTLSQEMCTETLHIISRILNTLRHTGMDPTVHLQKLRYNLLQRLILSERKKQHSRLRETPTNCAQGEAVLVLAEHK
ncbi:hypothetical protein N7540_000227 [Penicillium herquei]|nr:hypothetical protein N7540_000227 [Penicillium herquei]